MPNDNMSPFQKREASRLIDLFLRLVSANDVRQLVQEMEEELAKPTDGPVVRAENSATREGGVASHPDNKAE